MDDYGDFESLWEAQKREVDADVEVSEEQLTAVTDEYMVNDAIAYFSHATTILDIYLHAKIGKPLEIKLDIDEEGLYEYDFM